MVTRKHQTFPENSAPVIRPEIPRKLQSSSPREEGADDPTFSQRLDEFSIDVFGSDVIRVQGLLNGCSYFLQVVAPDLPFAFDGRSQSCDLRDRELDKVLMPIVYPGVGSLSLNPVSLNSASHKHLFRSNGQIEMRQTVPGDGQRGDYPLRLIVRLVEQKDRQAVLIRHQTLDCVRLGLLRFKPRQAVPVPFLAQLSANHCHENQLSRERTRSSRSSLSSGTVSLASACRRWETAARSSR